MGACFVPKCRHRSPRNDCRFFRFPSNERLLKKWIRNMRRIDKKPGGSSRICSCHFVDGIKANDPTIFPWNKEKLFSFKYPEQRSVRNTKGKPKKNSFQITDSNDALISSTESTEDQFDIKNLCDVVIVTVSDDNVGIGSEFGDDNSSEGTLTAVEDSFATISESNSNFDILSESSYNNRIIDTQVEAYAFTKDASTQTIHSVQVEAENFLLKSEIENLKKQIAFLKNQPFGFHAIEHSDKLITSYCGINKECFSIIHTLCDKFEFRYRYNKSGPKKLSLRDQILLTLMKLRLNLTHDDLCVRFNINIEALTNVIRTLITVLHEVLYKPLMKEIPSLEKNEQCNFNGRLIIDCVEFGSEITAPKEEQEKTFRSDKHKKSVKVLIGIESNGVITYCSDAYPGSLSDQAIIQKCGVLDQINPNDLILANANLTIRDILPARVSLNIPHLLEFDQSTPVEIKATKNAARARILVERAVKRLRHFTILNMFHKSLFSYASEIIQVCVALTNLRNPIIEKVDDSVHVNEVSE